MSHFARLIAAIMVLFATSSAQAEIPWHVQLRDAHAVATKEGKPLLLHFYADNCTWCEKLEKGAFASPLVAAAIENDFVPVKVHANTSPSLAKMFKVDKFPTDVVVTSTGKTLSHSVSPQDVSRYVEMLQESLVTLEVTPGLLANMKSPPVGTGQPNHPSESSTQSGKSSPTDPSNVIDETKPTEARFATLGVSPKDTSAKTVRSGETPPPEYATLEKPITPLKPAAAPAESENLELDPTVISLPANASELIAEANQQTPNSATSSIQLPELESTVDPILAETRPENPASSNQFAEPAKENRENANYNGNEIVDTAAARKTAQASDMNAVSNETPAKPASAELNAATSGSSPKLALEGFCAVTVIKEDQWTEGDPTLSVIHLGKLYLFSSVEKRNEFLANPTPFTPVLNEIDPVVFFEERRIVPGKREWGMKDPIHQRMFFFADEASMNHFYQQYERYTQSAIDLMDRAIKETHPES